MVLRLLGAPHREDDLGYVADSDHPNAYPDIIRDDWIVPVPISKHPEGGEGVFFADFFSVYSRGRLVVQVEVRGVRYKTKDGLARASTGAQWRKHFPDFETTFHHFRHPSEGGWPAAKHNVLYLDATKAGIAWRFGAMGDLAPDPSPEGWVEAVAVHAPGTPVIVDPDGGSRFIWKDAPRRLSTEH